MLAVAKIPKETPKLLFSLHILIHENQKSRLMFWKFSFPIFIQPPN